ncbi:MAG TPA: hypothetical protein VFL19_03490 [Nitrospira sp.]|nr:hypothetical protein [Nitrospira sp.]
MMGDNLSASLSLKLGLLLFWALWYLFALTTNLCEGFEQLRIFPRTWSFASRNFRAIAQATSRYSVSRRLPGFLFFGVLCWQVAAVVLFTSAIAVSALAGALDSQAVNAAFIAGLSLWSAFMLADEFLQQYEVEHAHVLFFMAQLLTLIALHQLPA